MINLSQERIKAGLLLLALLLLWTLITVPAAAAPPLDPNHTILEEFPILFESNLSVNETHLHHMDIYHPLEIPPWLWMFFVGGTFFFLMISLMYRGAISVNLITSVISILFAFTAEFTSFIIREYVVDTGFYFIPSGDQLTPTATNLTLWSVIQHTDIAWDYLVPFWFMFPVVVICIINFIALALEMGKPGISYFRAGIMRRP